MRDVTVKCDDGVTTMDLKVDPTKFEVTPEGRLRQGRFPFDTAMIMYLWYHHDDAWLAENGVEVLRIREGSEVLQRGPAPADARANKDVSTF